MGSEMCIRDSRHSIVIGAMVDDAARVDTWTSKLQSEIEDFQAEFSGDYVIETLFAHF